MTAVTSIWRRAALVVGVVGAGAAPAIAALISQPYLASAAAATAVVAVGVSLVLGVRAFNTFLPIYADRARIENDRRRRERSTRHAESDSVQGTRVPSP